MALMATVSKWNVQEIPALVDVAVGTRRTSSPLPGTAPPRPTGTPPALPWNTGPCWKPLGEVPGLRGRQVPNHLPPERTTCGPSFSTRRGLFPIDETLDPDTIYDGCNCGTAT